MTTSQGTQFLSNLLPGNKPPQFVVGYLVSALMEEVHEAILDEFLEQEEAKEISKSVLATRLDKDPALINRWLSGPSNLTLETVGTLLAGMGCELSVDVVRIKNTLQEISGAENARPLPGETNVGSGLELLLRPPAQAKSAQGETQDNKFALAA